MKMHYVYKITDPKTKQFYIGSRTCNGNPENDNYMGSMVTWKPDDKDRLKKEIIKDDFETRENAIEFEDEMIGDHIDDELNENYHRPHKGFHTHGQVTVRDKNGNTFNVSTRDERYLNGSLKQATKGLITVKDRDGNTMKVSVSNPKYLNGELIPIRKGQSYTKKQLENITKKRKGMWTLDWYIKKYGKECGRILYNERCNKLSNQLSGKNHWNYGNKNPEQSKSMTGVGNPMYGVTGPNNNSSKRTKCLQNECCDAKEFDSAKECAKYHNISHSSVTWSARKAKKPKFKFIDSE